MKKREIWISAAIITAAVLVSYSYLQGTGQIKIDAGDAETTLRVNRGWFSNRALIKSKDGPVMMRARTYRPELLSISMQQDGNTWRLDSSGPWGKLSTIKVRNNNTTVLKLGSPFLIKPRVHKIGSSVLIDFAIIGRAGEQYQNSARKGNRAVTGAKLEIIDEEANVIEAGRFKYG